MHLDLTVQIVPRSLPCSNAFFSPFTAPTLLPPASLWATSSLKRLKQQQCRRRVQWEMCWQEKTHKRTTGISHQPAPRTGRIRSKCRCCCCCCWLEGDINVSRGTVLSAKRFCCSLDHFHNNIPPNNRQPLQGEWVSEWIPKAHYVCLSSPTDWGNRKGEGEWNEWMNEWMRRGTKARQFTKPSKDNNTNYGDHKLAMIKSICRFLLMAIAAKCLYSFPDNILLKIKNRRKVAFCFRRL